MRNTCEKASRCLQVHFGLGVEEMNHPSACAASHLESLNSLRVRDLDRAGPFSDRIFVGMMEVFRPTSGKWRAGDGSRSAHRRDGPRPGVASIVSGRVVSTVMSRLTHRCVEHPGLEL